MRSLTQIRVLVPLATVLFVSIAAVGLGWRAEQDSREALRHELETRLLVEARQLSSVAREALQDEFPELLLNPLLRDLQEGRPDLGLLEIVDHRGLLLGHAESRRLGTAVEAYPMRGGDIDFRLLPGERFVEAPGLFALEIDLGEDQGTIRMGLDAESLQSTLDSHRSGMLSLSLWVLLGVACASIIAIRALLLPISDLREGISRIGQGQENPVRVRGRSELSSLAQELNQMDRRLRRAHGTRIEKERLQHEMDLAAGVQRRLLPKLPIQIEGWHIEGRQEAATQVGGDLLDVFPLPGGKIGLFIADVAGKGLRGCLVSSMLSSLIGALRTTYDSPAQLLLEIDAILRERLEPGVFVTAFYGILDPATSSLCFASAGHSPLLLARPNEASRWIRSEATPLCIGPRSLLERELQDHTESLEVGAILVQHTDGYSEAPDSNGQEFGLARLAEITTRHAQSGPAAVAEAIHAAVGEWAGERSSFDDQTLLVAAPQTVPCPPPEFGALGSPCHIQDDVRLLDSLQEWLGTDYPANQLQAAYETAMNILEHGYSETEDRPIYLWKAANSLVLADRATPFDPAGTNLLDEAMVRRREEARGWGVELIRAATSSLDYRPSHGDWNFTKLAFEPPLEES